MDSAVHEKVLGELNGLISHTEWSDQKILAKCISLLETENLSGSQIRNTFKKVKTLTRVIGLTGPAGVGKSTLLNSLTKIAISQDFRVAIIALDPISELTSGALLGDRIRLSSDIDLNQVYFRSLATDNSSNGIPLSLPSILELLSCFEFDFIIIETIGAGQLNTEIRAHVTTLINVLAPNIGDEIQFAKSGLMEIGDIYFINKCDQGNAVWVEKLLKRKFESKSHESGLEYPKVLVGSALQTIGIPELFHEVNAHFQWVSLKKREGR
jgi:LAO/AO transport system kinase